MSINYNNVTHNETQRMHLKIWVCLSTRSNIYCTLKIQSKAPLYTQELPIRFSMISCPVETVERPIYQHPHQASFPFLIFPSVKHPIYQHHHQASFSFLIFPSLPTTACNCFSNCKQSKR